jgi:hypothetical protein
MSGNMSRINLNAVVTKALLDHTFQAGLLNGRRRENLASLRLSEDEIKALMGIEANTINQFIFQVNALVYMSEYIN